MKKVLVVGSINKDVTLQMDSLPVPGETVIARSISKSLGGKGANQAVAVAKMGGIVSFIGAIGSSKSDDEIIERFEKNKIDTSGIARLEESTGTAYISIDGEAENNIIVYPGANFAFSEKHLYNNVNLFETSDYCLLQLEVPISIIRETVKICRQKEVKIILNPAPYSNEIDEELLQSVDFYIPNEIEFLNTIGADLQSNYDLPWFEEKGKAFSSKYNLTLIITLGSRGAMLFDGDKVKMIPVQETIPVDTTAAGDSFIGGFLASLSSGKDIEEALNFGSKVAAITISRYGAISAIPSKEEVQ